jgi:hypothetical protein
VLIRLLFRLLGRHPSILTFTREALATSTGALQTVSAVRDPDQPSEVSFPSI